MKGLMQKTAYDLIINMVLVNSQITPFKVSNSSGDPPTFAEELPLLQLKAN